MVYFEIQLFVMKIAIVMLIKKSPILIAIRIPAGFV
ncbi:hypothetical protein CLV98_105220 [Dyadobacter jejuensis]|uniref:Uncharacterized protein n=1 Tax=Dyadobacter jejuensis TaxID=1082580 RepID=A0A316AMM3_9BACT|nr:hypothetical protein CLV98_105220 [Dyadobacter jejuensis]